MEKEWWAVTLQKISRKNKNEPQQPGGRAAVVLHFTFTLTETVAACLHLINLSEIWHFVANTISILVTFANRLVKKTHPHTFLLECWIKWRLCHWLSCRTCIPLLFFYCYHWQHNPWGHFFFIFGLAPSCLGLCWSAGPGRLPGLSLYCTRSHPLLFSKAKHNFSMSTSQILSSQLYQVSGYDWVIRSSVLKFATWGSLESCHVTWFRCLVSLWNMMLFFVTGPNSWTTSNIKILNNVSNGKQTVTFTIEYTLTFFLLFYVFNSNTDFKCREILPLSYCKYVITYSKSRIQVGRFRSLKRTDRRKAKQSASQTH